MLLVLLLSLWVFFTIDAMVEMPQPRYDNEPDLTRGRDTLYFIGAFAVFTGVFSGVLWLINNH